MKKHIEVNLPDFGAEAPTGLVEGFPQGNDLALLYDVGDRITEVLGKMGIRCSDTGTGVAGRDLGFAFGDRRMEITIKIEAAP